MQHRLNMSSRDDAVVRSSRAPFVIPQLDDKEVSYACSLDEGLVDREGISQSSPFNGNGSDMVKEEVFQEDSYRSDTLDDLDKDLGPGLSRCIILLQNDDTLTKSTWTSVDMMIAA